MKSQHAQFTPPSPEIENRIGAVLARLSLEEKIDLLGGQRDPKDGGDITWSTACMPSSTTC